MLILDSAASCPVNSFHSELFSYADSGQCRVVSSEQFSF